VVGEDRGDNKEGASDPIAASVGGGETANRDQITKQQTSISEQALVDRIKRSDRWMIWLTAAIAFSGIVSAIIFGRQLGIMQGQLDEMRFEQRPWLSAVPKIIGHLSNKGGLLSTMVEIDVSNVGHIPASGVRGGAVITGGGNHRIVTRNDIQEVCDRVASSGFDQDSEAALIFPNGSDSLVAEAPDQRAFGDGEIPQPSDARFGSDTALVYCVSYLNAGNEPMRHTGGAFAIGGIKPGSILKDGEMIDPSQLELVHAPFDPKWRSYAD
jgi:hypothetical protein